MILQFAVSFGFMLVVNAPQNLVAFGTGTFRARDFTRSGVVITLVGYGVVVAFATALSFSLAQPIGRFLGKTGINVMTRLMGLILAALAVEVMSDGLTKLFPLLGR
jgi:multiple antibiotic resistance protein